MANVVESALAYLAFPHPLWSVCVCSEYASPKSDGRPTTRATCLPQAGSAGGGGGDDGSVSANSSGGGGAASGKVGAAGKRSSVPLTC